MGRLELWAGPECTVNRIGDVYRDQIRETGHHDRADDLDLFARLGITSIRYPVLWERVAPQSPDRLDWAWTDNRLHHLRRLNVRPIAGLVHHGSGPAYTNLLADDFATGLAAFARAAAERYPWIESWTPVNEPVTTARFSALYGLWYPHVSDERNFWVALINQIDGVRRAMAEIRKVIPTAKLIQPDDLGRTYATAAVRDQAAFDNQRRWMGWDLLCGRVTRGHPLWSRLCDLGFGDRLRRIADSPCPPDIVGVNHYLTSDRFLDHRLKRYPAHLAGGSGARRFVDTEAVRVLTPPPSGLRGVLAEAWDRYGLPLAVTEAHNGCTREEQMRWMANAWSTAVDLRAQGMDICAVTSWALLGSSGWDTLLTELGSYEPGAFDVSGGAPRATAMAELLRSLAKGGEVHPLCEGDGWWQRSVRLHHPETPRPAPMCQHARRATPERSLNGCLLVVTDSPGTAGRLAEACAHRNLPVRIESDLQADALSVSDNWAVILVAPSGNAVRLIERSAKSWIQTAIEDDANAVLDRVIDEAMIVRAATRHNESKIA